MRYHALIADYDGTLAHHGVIAGETWSALQRVRTSGRKLVMATGRILEDVLALLPEPELFSRIVAENGAVVYEPATKATRFVSEKPPEDFIEALVQRGVPLEVGHIIVATREPHQDVVLETIRDHGLELQVIFNKGAVMVLPSGVNKATGVSAALVELGLSAHNTVAVGDAENDHALLGAAECGVAVANALPSLKDAADLVTHGGHGEGVAELIDHLLQDDLAEVVPSLTRHTIPLGTIATQELHAVELARHLVTPSAGTPTVGLPQVAIDPYASNLMICGTSGSGKSTVTTGLLERLAAAGYQYAVIDPEGDYTALDSAVVLGAPGRAPLVDEVSDMLRDPARNVVVNMLGIAIEDRPAFYGELAAVIGDLRTRTGRPHWVIVDEAHHLLPTAWQPVGELPPRPHGTLYVTVHPGSVAPTVLATINTLLVVGAHPEVTLRDLCEARGVPCPDAAEVAGIDQLAPGQVLYWKIGAPRAVVVQTERPKHERVRHHRKYVEGNLGPDRSFYFRGPQDKLNLKAPNLLVFAALADGIDDETWTHHLARGEYSQWFRTALKDGELADVAAAIEEDAALSPRASRAAIRAAIEQRYTLPADRPSGLVE